MELSPPAADCTKSASIQLHEQMFFSVRKKRPRTADESVHEEREGAVQKVWTASIILKTNEFLCDRI